MAVLAGFARGEGRERANRKAEVERDAVKVTGADAGARQNEQAMLLQKLAEFVHDRKDRIRAAIHDRAAADLHDLHPREEPDGTPARDRAGEIGVEQGLARERRGDVLGRIGGFGHGGQPHFAVMMVPTCSPASARVRLPATRPFTTCTSWM